MIAYRKLNKDWLWEEFIQLAIREKGLIGEDIGKFTREPNHHYLKKLAVKLIPDCKSENYSNLGSGLPPPVRELPNQYCKPRAKTPKKDKK